MRKGVAFGLTVAMAMSVPCGALAAAGPVKAKAEEARPATVKGDARDARGQKLASTKVRVRNAATGAIAAEVLSDAAGGFVAAGLVPASYVVEVVGVNGLVVGLSPAIAVAAGATATVTVTASAVLGAAAAAGATAGGLGVLGLGTAASVGVIGAAATAAVVGVKAAQNDASPSGQ